MDPPVCARSVPSVRVVRALLVLSFLPFAVVGARALVYHKTMAIAFALCIGAIVSAVLAHRSARRDDAFIAACAIAALPSFAIAYVTATGMRLPWMLAVVCGAAIAAAAGVAFATALRACAEADRHARDASAFPLATTAAWVAIMAVLLRFGSETGHLHLVFPAMSVVATLIGAALAALATANLMAQRVWTARLYRNELRSLRVGPIPSGVDPDTVPALSADEDDAAIVVDGPQQGAYRGCSSVVARVPSAPHRLLGRYTRGVRIAALGVAWSVIGVLAWPHAAGAHADETERAPRMRLPQWCRAKRWPTVRLVPLAPLELVDVERIAKRYREAGLPDVQVEAALPFESRFFDPKRNQLEADEIVNGVRRAYLSLSAVPHWPNVERELFVVITDRDMYLPGTASFAFSIAERGIAVVSLARLDPSFPLIATESYVPRRPACSASLMERAYKSITREVVGATCGDRPRIWELSQLDGLDEADLLDGVARW